METAFEALPPRDSKRLKKRARVEEPRPSHGSSHAGDDDGANRKQEGSARVIYDSEGHLQYEFLDHTADVQLHAWGATLGEAFAHCALAQWGYMTEPSSVLTDPECDRVIEASGRDPITLLYTFLDRCLYEFTGDDFLANQLQVLDFVCPGVPRSLPDSLIGPDGDDSHRPEPCYMRVAARGERFVFRRHPQGTEVKAVTFSNMQIVVDVSDAGVGARGPSAGGYSGVTDVVRGGVALRQYSANEAGPGAEAAAGEGAAGGGGAPYGGGAPPRADPAAGAVTTGGEGGPRQEGARAPAASGGPSLDGHAGGELMGTRRGPVDVYVIVDI